MRGVKRGSAPDAWTLAAWACAGPAALSAVGDPDLWWHLSSARWMTLHRAVPRRDWLSWTLPGAPWINFEWLGEIILYAAYSLAGHGGLWVLKASAVAALCAVVWRGLKRFDCGEPARAACFALFGAALIARGDLRLELFSLAAFAGLLFRLDAAQERRAGAPAAWKIALLFAVWANVHAGFIMGLFLLGAYGAAAAYRRRDFSLLRLLAAAAAAACVNPYGLGVYRVLGAHLADSASLGGLIDEWGAATAAKRSHWPVFAAIFAAAAGLLLRPLDVPRFPARTVVFLVLAAGTLRHIRLAGYAAAACALYLCGVLEHARLGGLRFGGRPLRAVSLFSLFLALAGAGGGLFAGVTDLSLSPVRAAEFIARHPEVASLRFYNAWGWGGYLGWRLGGGSAVFQDGRYIFHGLLKEAKAAVSSPAAWAEFLRARGVEAALLQNRGVMLETLRRYPDGSQAAFRRPYYAVYMPKDDWALAYWDEKALLFIRRDVFSSGRMPPEYRLLRPRDGDALSDAVSRGEVSLERLEAERRRHRRELESLPRRPPVP